MNVTIRKIGHSEVIIIPKEVLARLGLKTDDSLERKLENGGINMKPVNEDFPRQLEAPRNFVGKYKVALKKPAE
ncbi:AbrB family transcriptional regulator [Rhizobium leguminosarum bv. trifolii]|uniref:AbrB/MazE/SpoVT family DNA-binding domain-containing protein n=1 Tax=Rhizobium leguminosarum TaxID=384 RepID=UPI000E2EBE8A|nr:AbrB family transcriptional regulator [Rhizobium leguminosarum]RFB94805.1 AbrB family transcriptional regulator [Rhizobium leguminosarum bv. trifolii]